MTRTIRARIAAAVLTAAIGGGCGGGAVPAPASLAPAAAALPRANPADVEFMQGMIHHHSQALQMASLSASRGANPAIQLLSERIFVGQTDEIRVISIWLADHGEEVPMAGAEHAGHGDHGGVLMPGMLTPEQMAALEAAHGVEYDRLFLEGMIQHHQGALTMVDQVLNSYGGGLDDLVYKFASDTYADQGIEIDRMQQMLAAIQRSESR